MFPEGWVTGDNASHIKTTLDDFVKEYQKELDTFSRNHYDLAAEEHKMEMDGKLTWDAIQKRQEERWQQLDTYRDNIANKLAENLTKVIGKHTKVEYLGGGQAKNVFKIEVDDSEPIVIDVFTNTTKHDSSHGQWVEIPRGPFLNTHSGGQSDNFAHFYYGKHEENGYSLLQFIDSKGNNKQLNTNNGDFIVRTTDRQAANILNGVVVDYGQLQIGRLNDTKVWNLEEYVVNSCNISPKVVN